MKDSGERAYVMLPVFRKQVAKALDCTRYAYDLCKRPYVAFSAGKDSSVMLHLALQVQPRAIVRILTGGETRLLHQNIDIVLAWWREQFPKMDFEEICIDHVFAPGWEDATFFDQYQTFQNEWEKYLHGSGDYDGCFVGLRAEESRLRKAWLRERMDGHAIRQYTSGKEKRGSYRICPLADWHTKDVAAYITQNAIPLLDGYEKDWEARTKTRIGGRAMIQYGQLAELRARDPESYRKLIERFPELARWT